MPNWKKIITSGSDAALQSLTVSTTITANSFKTPTGTPSQFLMADGSVNSSTYSVTTHTHTFASLTSIPTTIAGYGITDAPTKTGSGASGTWGISISGNAATATNATSSSISNSLNKYDQRTLSPSLGATGAMQFGVTSWNNNNTSPYADFIHMRSYQDSTGGSDNLITFLKSGIGMRIWQQTYGSTTAYSSYKDVAFTDGSNATGTWGISTTGNAATATTLQTARTLTIGATGKTFNGSANVAWTLVEIGAQAALTNPITGTATSGQVAFFNGTTTQTGDTNLFWDNTNKRLGIGATSPTEKLDVNGNIRATSFIKSGGTSSQFLKADGSIDGTNYIQTLSTSIDNTGRYLSISGGNQVRIDSRLVHVLDSPNRNPNDPIFYPNVTGRSVRFDFIAAPYVSGTGNYAGVMTFSPWDGTTNSTGDSSYQLAFYNQTGINGSGIPGLRIRKGIDTTWNSWYKIYTDGDFSQSHINNWNAAYGWGNHASAGYLKSSDLSNYVTTNTTQTITGHKEFQATDNIYYQTSLQVKGNGSTILPGIGFHQPGVVGNQLNMANDGWFQFVNDSNSDYANLRVKNISSNGMLTFGNNEGGVYGVMGDNDAYRIWGRAAGSNQGYLEISTADDGNEPIIVSQYVGQFISKVRQAVLLNEAGNTSFPGTVTATSFIKSGGTSSQYLMADGSVSTLTNPITGTGTTNYIPKFTASGTIGNSLIFDNGTNVGIGTTSPSTLLDVNSWATFLGSPGNRLKIWDGTDNIPTISADNLLVLDSLNIQFYATDVTDSNNNSIYLKLKTITGNTTLDNTYHNKIVRITASCIITIPNNLRTDFNCTFEVIGAYTAQFVDGSGATTSAPFGRYLKTDLTAMFYCTGIASNYRLNGSLATS